MKRLTLFAVAAVVWGSAVAGAAAAAHTTSTSRECGRAKLERLPLRLGSHGRRTCGLQWLLQGHRPAVFRINAYRHPIDGLYTRKTATAVKNTKWFLGYPRPLVNGTAGRQLFEILEGKRARPLAWRITAGKRAWERTHHKPHPKPLNAKVRTLVRDADYLIAHAPLVHYSQTTRMQIVRYRLHLPPLTRSIWEDCSSSTTGLYWLAGLADPNGLGYDGFGYTGTQASHGRIVWRIGDSLARLRAGDLIFYGPFPHRHVTMYLGAGHVFSHGSEDGPYNLPALYRGDAVYARRYVG